MAYLRGRVFQGEEVRIPSSAPYTARLNEVPDREADFAVSRIGPAEAVYIQGDGSCVTSGFYLGEANTEFVVEIDSGGGVGTATFRWSKDGGSVWEMSGVVTSGEPIELTDGVLVRFGGQNLVVGDRWRFSVERFVRTPGLPTGTGMFYVDFSRGYLTFHAADAGKLVRARYSGTGSLVDAEDINQLGALLMRVGSFSLTAGSGETLVSDSRVAQGSRVFLCPRNQQAASLGVYVSAVFEGSGFRVRPIGTASGEEEFDYVVFG